MESSKSAVEWLAETGEIVLGEDSGLTWDCYSLNDKQHLRKKVWLAFGKTEEDNSDTLAPTVEHVIERVWDQIKYTKNSLKMSVIELLLVSSETNWPMLATKFNMQPLFRCMKCVCPKTKRADNKCMVFVDAYGYVYQSWNDFKTNTLYADTWIVAPKDGIFQRDSQGRIQLEQFEAPRTKAVLEREQINNTCQALGGLGSSCVLIASLFVPVAAPLLLGATLVGGAVAATSGVSAASRLSTLRQREQSIGLENPEALSHWLNIAGMGASLGASGLASSVSKLALTGQVSQGLKMASNVTSVAAVGLNGANVVNSAVAMYGNDQSPSALELANFAASLFLFTHSVKNFKLANELILETQKQHMDVDYRNTLSKWGRKRYNNRMNNRVRQGGAEGAYNQSLRYLRQSEHYQQNFMANNASGGISSKSSDVTSDNILQLVIAGFKLYKPHSGEELLEMYKRIVAEVKVEGWQVLQSMAEKIMTRLALGSANITDIMGDLYEESLNVAKRMKVRAADLWNEYTDTYESIPAFLKVLFAHMEVVTGSVLCATCQGVYHCG